MKNYYLLLFFCCTLLLSACKKYTCECTFNLPGSPYVYEADDQTYSGSRSQAESECTAREQHVSDSNPTATNVECDLVD